MNFQRSQALQQRIHQLIPGGAHTYAKGDDQYPEQMPVALVRGEGCHVWDVDGNEFIEYGMGLRAVTLGHAYPPVVEAAYQQMCLGSNFARPATIELACAEKFLHLIEGAEMVKFAKNGSDVTTPIQGATGLRSVPSSLFSPLTIGLSAAQRWRRASRKLSAI
jgi:glutamate-1-semialdehyde 2,1-aminomutase